MGRCSTSMSGVVDWSSGASLLICGRTVWTSSRITKSRKLGNPTADAEPEQGQHYESDISHVFPELHFGGLTSWYDLTFLHRVCFGPSRQYRSEVTSNLHRTRWGVGFSQLRLFFFTVYFSLRALHLCVCAIALLLSSFKSACFKHEDIRRPTVGLECRELST